MQEIKVAIETVNEKLMEGAKQKTVDKISKSIDKLDKEVKIAANAVKVSHAYMGQILQDGKKVLEMS